jgi:capsular exopolysaccharide synthesis family protein
MSDIFDALQRSEGECSQKDSPVPSEATELLRRAERRAASKWETAVLVEHPAATENSERDWPLEPDEGPPDAAAEKALAAGELSPTDGSVDIFGQFQPLPVSVTAQSRLICFTENESLGAEAFRLLALRLRDLQRKRPLKKVLVTSTIPQEGKSVSAANLACTLALRVTQKILIVEGDLRRPSFSQIFGIGSVSGLSECLRGERSLIASIYHLEGPNLWLLPAGISPSNPLELLQSGRLPALMDQLAAWFDWIIIDSPPILPLADASVWTRLADGVLLVTRQGVTEKRQLLKGLEAIDVKKLIGALLNCSRNAAHSDYYYSKRTVSVPTNNPTS